MSVPILTYHSIDTSGSIVSTHPRTFGRQMRYLKEQGYRAITLAEMAEQQQKDDDERLEKTVVLTFDDGFRNFYTDAFPVLNELGFKATVFLVTGHCGHHNDWAGNPAGLPRSELLSWEEIRELSSHGIEFGSHTRTHPDLTALSEDAIRHEMLDSKKEISERIGREVCSFAYPYGRMNPEARRLALENFKFACSTNLGKVKPEQDRASLNRIDTFYLSNQRVFEMLSTARFDNYLRLRQAMRRVRSMIVGH